MVVKKAANMIFLSGHDSMKLDETLLDDFQFLIKNGLRNKKRIVNRY